MLKQFNGATLDLADPANYRDLSRPVGAQEDERLAALKKRYDTWDVEETGLPPFHYGSHYSTPGYTLWWLMRMEPFTRLFLEMQGGQFDHPDRAFSSLHRAWTNCTVSSTDNRELIPELFYLPELFTNRNAYDLGVDEEGLPVDHVRLPPWASSWNEFCRLHRSALESECVMSLLAYAAVIPFPRCYGW